MRSGDDKIRAFVLIHSKYIIILNSHYAWSFLFVLLAPRAAKRLTPKSAVTGEETWNCAVLI